MLNWITLYVVNILLTNVKDGQPLHDARRARQRRQAIIPVRWGSASSLTTTSM